VVGLCNLLHGESQGSKVGVLVVDAQQVAHKRVNCLGRTLKEGLIVG